MPPFGSDIEKGCIAADETFEGTWPWTPNFFDGNGFSQHYVDEGDKDAEVIVLLHGSVLLVVTHVLTSYAQRAHLGIPLSQFYRPS